MRLAKSYSLRNSLLVLLLGVVAAVAVLSRPVFTATAQPFGGPPPGDMGPGENGPGPGPGPGGPLIGLFFAPDLELTSDQQTSVQSILDSARSTMETDMDAMRTAENNLLVYLAGGGSDTTLISTYTALIGTATETLKTEEANVFVSLYSLLTDTQKSTLASLAAQMTSSSSSSSSVSSSSSSSSSSTSSTAAKKKRSAKRRH